MNSAKERFLGFITCEEAVTGDRLTFRFGPVTPHFGQTPWNEVEPSFRILPRVFRQNGEAAGVSSLG